MKSIGLTKGEVAGLSAGQQEVIARLALDEARQRRELLAKAKGYKGVWIIQILLWLGLFFCFWRGYSVAAALPYFMCALMFLLHFHITGINRRIDAVLTLLDLENPAEALPTTPPATGVIPDASA